MASPKVLLLGILLLGGGIGIGNGSAADCPTLSNGDDLPQDQFISQLTDPCRYDKYVRPNTTTPLPINVTMEITHMEATQSQFTSYMTVQFVYLDSNLNYETSSPQRTIILGDESLKAKIWTPNILMRDESGTSVIATSTKDIVVSITKTGLVTYSYKMTVQFNCQMDLKKFPFDYQRCKIAFSDWSNNAANVDLKWTQTPPFYKAADLHFSEYIMDEAEFNLGSDAGPYPGLPVGTFTKLTIEFKFHRDIGYYLLDFFIPSYLLVFTAWVTFWLQADAGPPRATLGASTVVAFITLHLGVSKDIPKVSYVKASDVWFLAVIFFIFLSLAEFAFVNVIWRRKKHIELKKPKPKYVLKSAFMPQKSREDLQRYASTLSLATIGQSNDSLNSTKPLPLQGNYKSVDSLDSANCHTAISIPGSDEQVFTWTKMTPQEVAIYVDRKARIVFPVTFLIFNVLYWVFVYCL
ncbi:hypothetical protein Zmor_022472 [Zophobas morio]|uniref:Uncharacterized protein n=1 Tax=Zophobas morio TaxID=2755281 RepID=A0AA38M6U1_9CUCU|nr:hypothetical protein Zmor_022472 [Zophobas morio]